MHEMKYDDVYYKFISRPSYGTALDLSYIGLQGAGWVFSSDPAPGGSWGGPGTTPKTPQIPLYQRQIFCDF